MSPIAWRGGALAALWAFVVVAAIALDRALHALDLAWVGFWLGPIGTSLIIVSFVYSLRKRGWIQLSSPKRLLRLHEALALTGALLVLVHGGVHFHAFLPWLAVAAMMIAVASGLMGEFLLSNARRRLTTHARQLEESGLDATRVDKQLQSEALVVRGMETWRVVHLPIAINFAVLAVLHIATSVVFG